MRTRLRQSSRALSGTVSWLVTALVLATADAAVAATKLGGKTTSGGKPPPPSHTAVVAGRWSVLIALGVLVIGLPLVIWVIRLVYCGGSYLAGKKISIPLPRFGRGLVVGADQRASTSKTIATVWTYTVAAALLSFLIARWIGHPQGWDALNAQGLNAQYALLIGGPIGAAILAKGIVTAQIDNGDTSKPSADTTNPAQLAQNDTGDTSLGDVQYLLFNTVALAFFYGELLRVPLNGMPTIPDVLLGLTSVAAAGYVGNKALTGPATISNVDPKSGPVGTTVNLLTTGIAKTGDDLSHITVAFGAGSGQPVSITATTTQGELLEINVPEGAAGVVDIAVSVPNGKSATWPKFAVTPVVFDDPATLQGEPDTEVPIITSGVKGLSNLKDVTLQFDGTNASNLAQDPNDQNKLVVPVPKDLPPGPTKLTLKTPGGTSTPVQFTVLAK